MVGVPRLATVVEVSREDLERGLIVPPRTELYIVAVVKTTFKKNHRLQAAQDIRIAH